MKKYASLALNLMCFFFFVLFCFLFVRLNIALMTVVEKLALMCQHLNFSEWKKTNTTQCYCINICSS